MAKYIGVEKAHQKLWETVINRAIEEAEGSHDYNKDEKEHWMVMYHARRFLTTPSRSLHEVLSYNDMSRKAQRVFVEQARRRFLEEKES